MGRSGSGAPAAPTGSGIDVAGRRALVALLATLVALAAWNVGRILFVPTELHLWTNATVTAVFVVLGVVGGLDLDGFGLARRHLLAGLAYGGTVFGVVLAGLVFVAVFPPTSDLLRDDRVLVDGPGMVFIVLVDIPFGTVLLEELAFRGTLLGLLRARWGVRVAVVASSLIFGLWHVAGVINDAGDDPVLAVAAAVAGTLVATTIAGVGFAWLRVRSQSLVAPILAHIATNSLTFAAAWIVSQ